MATKDRTSLKNDFANGKYATGEKFADLIDSMKVVQLPVVDPQALGTSLSFIDSISQDADGKITATKKTLDLANAHELNPFKGWYKTGDTLPTDGFDGAYLYFKDTTQTPAVTTIYRWNGTAYADTGTEVDESNVQTFATRQAVNEVHIKDENGDDDPNAQGVLSAEAGQTIVNTTMELVESANLLNPSTVTPNVYVKRTDGNLRVGSNIGVTPYIPIPDEGLICNHTMKSSGSYDGSGAVYKLVDGEYVFVAAISQNVNDGNPAVVSKVNSDYQYARFNLYWGTTPDIDFSECGVYKGSTLPSPFIPYEAPYYRMKTNIPDGSVTFEKLSGEIVATDIVPNTTPNKLADARQINNLLDAEEVRGKNLLYYPWEDNAYDSTGILAPGGTYHHMDVPCEPSTSYCLSTAGGSGSAGHIGGSTRYVVLLDANKNVLSVVGNTGTWRMVITTTADTAYIGVSAQKVAVDLQLEVGEVRTSYEAPFEPYYAYKIKESMLPPATIPDGSITTDKLQEQCVTPQKTDFFKSINLYDKNNDLEYAPGKYITIIGNLTPNSSYNTTGFIEVKPNTQYYVMRGGTPRFILGFDSNKSPISEEYIATSEFLSGNNTAYVRITFYAASAYGQNYGFAESSERLPYEPYSLKLLQEYLPGNIVNNIPFFLPKHIYVASGRTIEIYYNQVMLYAERYNIQATCSIGKALDRKFQIVGDDSHVGNSYTLTITAYDDSMNVVGYGTSTIHIVSNIVSSSKNVLPVGDSLTNNKAWLDELTNLSANIIPVGTRGMYNRAFHEGRSGASIANTYLKLDGSIVYSYDNSYRGVGYGTAPLFDDTQSYNAGDKVKIVYDTWYRYYIFKQNHAPGPWNASEVYCYSDGNPFYDYVNESFSMNFYKSFFGVNYDAIILFLGTNGMNDTPETNPNGALGMKNLIEAIREDEPTIPIIVVNTIFRSSQNGIGNQGNTDGYTAQSAYKYDADKKVLLLAKAIDELCGSMSNVYLCPVGFTHDSKYNFGNTKVAVNPRLTSTEDVYELQPSDSVHPQTSGYMQMADEIFSTLCAVFN